MTVSAAVIGLIGVLGGAIIGAFGAIYGPSRLHKRQTEQKTAEEAALKNEAAIKRIVALRATGRAWLDALERVAFDVDAGHIPHLEIFDALMGPLSDEMSQSAYEMSLDNTWLDSYQKWHVDELVELREREQAPKAQSVDDDTSPEPQSVDDDTPPEPQLFDVNTRYAYSDVLVWLRRANSNLRRDVQFASPGDSGGISPQTRKSLREAQLARAALNASLLARIEELTGKRAHFL